MTSEATSTIDIDLPLEKSWEILRDFTQAVNYVPNLTGCELHPGPEEGKGASRRVFQKNGKFLDETVTHWREKQGFVIRLHEGDGPAPAPFREACFIYKIQPKGDKTQLTTTMSYTIRFGFLGKLLDKFFVKKALDGAVNKISRNMKSYYETGVPSNKSIPEA